MKHLVLGLGALSLFAAAVAFSRSDKPSALSIELEKRNPWTSLQPNNDPAEFQFAIISDRTGGHRAKVFSRAVARLNLLQPAFVVSVGDLIEGGKQPDKKLEAEWQEFDGYVKQLQMPFFYVPGNHDVGNAGSDKLWRKRYGRRHYHFVYRDVLFLCMNTDDPPGSGAGHLSDEQVDYAKKTLADNSGVRWTIVLLHKPIWTAANLEKTGWPAVEKALADRAYTVFCGHIHRYRKFVRQGRNYYQLATTGGGSKMRGLAYGEFDHIVRVTMKKDGPVIANILLDSVLPDDLQVPESSESGKPLMKQKTQPVRGVVYLDGSPVVGAQVVFHPTGKPAKRPGADALTEGDGSFVLSTYTANDGAVAGPYAVTVTLRRPLFTADGKPGPNLLPAKYAKVETSGLKAEVAEGGGEVKLDLSSR
jgi:predicted phosphodiesterase